MGQVIAIQKPLEKLVLEIRGHVFDAGRAENTCAKHQLQAGLRLLELRQRVESGEAGDVTWWDWYETQFTGHIKSRRYAEKLMQWARTDDPEGAIESERERVRETMRASRERDRVSRDTDSTTDQSSERAEYDIVEHAMRLVERMDAGEREQFDEAYRSKFP